MGDLLGSVGYRVKILKITPATDKERGDLEIKDYVSLLDSLPTQGVQMVLLSLMAL